MRILRRSLRSMSSLVCTTRSKARVAASRPLSSAFLSLSISPMVRPSTHLSYLCALRCQQRPKENCWISKSVPTKTISTIEAMSALNLVYSEDYYLPIGAHVFPAEKYRLVHARLMKEGIGTKADFVEAQPASDEDILLVHT